MRRLVSYVLMAVVVVIALAVGTLDAGEARGDEDRLFDVAATIRCPQCASQSSADSDTSSARAVRSEIANRIEAGESDEAIRTYFASRYGNEILLNPPADGVGALVWIIPVVVTVVGGAGLAVAFRRWKRWE